MFELEAEIGKWRRSLEVAFGGKTPVIDELECHLRDDIARMSAAGNAAETAFELARSRLGRPDRLAAEFVGVVPVKVWSPARICLIFPIAFIVLELWMAYVSGALGSIPGLWRFRMVAISVGYAMSFYSLLVGLMFVAFRAFRPFGLDQVRFVGRTLARANFMTSCLLATGIALSLIGLWPTRVGSFRFAEIPVGLWLTFAWCAAMAGIWKFSIRRKYLSIPLSMFGSTIVNWDWYFRRLWTISVDGNMSYGFGPPAFVVIVLAIGTLLPILGITIGLLPAGVLRNRTA